MIVEYCDLCGSEIKELRDRHELSVLGHENKPSMPSEAMCAHCKEELRRYLDERKAASC